MRRWVVRIGMLLGALAAVGLVVATTGIVPIKASSGHWSITAWLLEFSMERSIATHALAIHTPPLEEPALVMKGATYYEIGCVFCHGSPEIPEPRMPEHMTPPPPALAPVVSNWKPKELFYIVKHGIKFTGMPAWPTQLRDDEVWAMVAFLRELPELDATEYRRLAKADGAREAAAAGVSPDMKPVAEADNCVACHGVDGGGREGGAFPALAGQRYTYLLASLEAFASERRHSGIMGPIAATLSRESMQALALHYSSMRSPRPPSGTPPNAAAVARGQAIAHSGLPAQRVPACVACHGPAGHRRNPFYPELAGQHADYIVLQLTLFKDQRRGGTPYAHLMRRVAPRLSGEQMRDVALYYASLKPHQSKDEHDRP